jgi:hypothetical protein
MEIPEKGPLQSPPRPKDRLRCAPHSVGESSVTHGRREMLAKGHGQPHGKWP